MPNPPKLDRINLRILQTLQTSGRITNLDLAEAVALSPSPCLERVKRLEAGGYIRHYLAEIDLDACLPHVRLMAEVTLDNHRKEDFRRFERAIAGIPEIISCYKIAGPYDYTMDIVCRDAPHYRSLEAGLLSGGFGIARIRSHEVQERTKPFSGFPLDLLATPDA